MRARTLKTLVVATAAALISSGLVRLSPDISGQVPNSPEHSELAEQVFKNIQIFKGVRAREIDGAMDFMAASLGVNCDYCHTSQFESDEKPSKNTARAMIQMTRDLNKTGFSGYDVVNCYTCHRGQVQPGSVPGTDEEAANAPDALTGVPSQSDPLPAIERVTEVYFQAVGGKVAIGQLRSLVAKGTRATQTGSLGKSVASIEIYEKPGADKYLLKTISSSGVVSHGFAGSVGSIGTQRGSRSLDENDLAKLKEDEEFYQYLKLKGTFPRMAVLGREVVSGREAYVIGAATASGQRVKLYFDGQNGLLLRKLVTRKTLLGTLLQTTDFGNYRVVGDLKLPFKITYTSPPITVTEELTEIKLNQPEKESVR
jgi:photosynthetic reaction center cytochrome c subunit